MLDFANRHNAHGFDYATIYSTDGSAPYHQPPALPAFQFPSKSASPGPQRRASAVPSLTFDPFADDSDESASSDSRSDHQPRLVSKPDQPRQHDRIHRVAAWVDRVSARPPSASSARYASSTAPPAYPSMKYPVYTPSHADTPHTYYVSAPPAATPAFPAPAQAVTDDEPYVIYSTGPSSSSLPSPVSLSAPPPSAVAPLPTPPGLATHRKRQHAPAKSLSVPSPRSSTARNTHRRYVSLSSIREEDETRA